MPVRWQLLRGLVLAQGDPIYEAGVQLGRLLRTAFWLTTLSRTLCERVAPVLNQRGPAPQARHIYTGRSARRRPNVSMKCRRCGRCVEPDVQHRDGVEYLLMQAVLDRWSNRRRSFHRN